MSHGDHGSKPRSMMDNSNNNMEMMMMQMNFYWGKDAVLLFSGWPGHSLGMYILALLVVFILAASVEVLSALPPLKHGMTSGKMHAVVYSLRMGLAYLVMLSVMSFNLGVFIMAVVGHGMGFFVVKTRFIAADDLTASPSSPNTKV
ncbi:copper transporter 6-like [Punica granatum]|uniref:Copper transport protein n=2 Tax=Punica granatum TaxID=22663 RepID=A0A218XAM7_PUNGR|nr:copper transporter 6-like [Punica granatum]OWM81770.1 hypothetical protein CDL15_Pgr007808 [Punica granatum]PKI43419.1 hypothetical protein CRG98_036176 [Punica granatum]